MDLLSSYRATIAEKGLQTDAAQEAAISALHRTGSNLAGAASHRHRAVPILRWLKNNRTDSGPVRGVYLWGDVGRGKTFVMDLFFESLPFDEKLRFHFHRLMYRIHRRLKKLRHLENPIGIIADEFAAQSRIICLDEFFVADIADAMILGKLLTALFERQVTLVATSNIPPDDLYHDGLQRGQFLPAIDLIKQHMEIIEVDGNTDYRLRVLEQARIFHSSLDESADRNLASYFDRIASDRYSTGQTLEILGREIVTRQRADGIAWFDFVALCDGPRSQDDYIEIARCFQTVILSDVPVMNSGQDNQVRRFIALVDEFYDRRVNLIISAAAEIADLYTGTRLQKEFRRTRSRLLEMQSTEYLAAGHLP